MVTRKILVANSGGKTIPADWLATFTQYIQGVAYQFAVTRVPGETSCRVTHKLSGKSLAAIEQVSVAAAKGDHKLAGKLALGAVIEKNGAARVASALRAAEA